MFASYHIIDRRGTDVIEDMCSRAVSRPFPVVVYKKNII